MSAGVATGKPETVRCECPIPRGDALGRLANQGAVVLTPLGAAVALTLRGAS